MLTAQGVASVDGVRFLVTGACQSTQANFSLHSICNGHSLPLLFWHLGKFLLFIRPYQYNVELSFGTSLSKVGSNGCNVFYRCEKSEQFNLLFFNNFFFFLYIFIIIQGKQHKMLQSDP